MKSKLTACADLDLAVADYPWMLREDESAVEDRLYQTALDYAVYVPAETVSRGDILTVQMRSSLPRYNRTLRLTVGEALFDAALEADMLGREINTDYTADLAQGQVQYRITGLERLVVPELTDEMAKDQQLPGVETAEDLRRHVTRSVLREQLQDQMGDFLQTLCDRSSFSIAEEDLDLLDHLEMERCRGIARGMDLVFDEMSEEQLLAAVGCAGIAEFQDMIHTMHRENLQLALIAREITGVSFELRSDQLYDQINRLSDQVVRRILDRCERRKSHDADSGAK